MAGKPRKYRKIIPIGTNEQGGDHVQLASDVEVKNYIASDEEEEDEDVKYSGKQAEIQQKFWDEVEMKHHGLVDSHAHHKEIQQQKLAQTKSKVPTLYEGKNVAVNPMMPSHIPYDEIAMKNSGFVDNRCHHMTDEDIERADGKEDSKHVQFPSVINLDASAEASEAEDKKSRHLRLDSSMDTVELAATTEDEKYRKIDTPQKGCSSHLPWDELELKEHGLVDKQCHHKVLPEDEIQLHREGRIDEHGQPTGHPSHLPFDELTMKRSGYVDSHGHHMTEEELNKQRKAATTHVDLDNVDVQSSVFSVSAASVDEEHTPSMQTYLPESKPKLDRRKRKLRINIKIKGVITVTPRNE